MEVLDGANEDRQFDRGALPRLRHIGQDDPTRYQRLPEVSGPQGHSRRHRLLDSTIKIGCPPRHHNPQIARLPRSGMFPHANVLDDTAPRLHDQTASSSCQTAPHDVRHVHHHVRRRERSRDETPPVRNLRMLRTMGSAGQLTTQQAQATAVSVHTAAGTKAPGPGPIDSTGHQRGLRPTLGETGSYRMSGDDNDASRDHGIQRSRECRHDDEVPQVGRNSNVTRNDDGQRGTRGAALRSTRQRRFTSFMEGVRGTSHRNPQPSWKNSERHHDAPLHAPTVPTMSKQLFLDMSTSPFLAANEKRALSFLHDPSNYRDPQSPPLRWPLSQALPQDVEQLVRNGLCEEVPDDVFKRHFGYIFTVYEERKRRRRLVHDTLSANFLCDRPPSPNFTPLNRLQDILSFGTHACTLDLKAMYYQIPLHANVRRFFPFRFNETHYQFTRLPMGFTWSVFIAQTIARFITRSLRNVHVQLYIDNIIIVGSQEDVETARKSFIDTCATYNITLSEDSGVVQTAMFRGINFDFANKTFRLDPSFVQKFHTRCASNNGTWCDWRALMGSMVYGLTALGESLAPFFHLLKWLAHNSTTSPWQQTTMWHQASVQWQAAVEVITTNASRLPCQSLSQHTIITDAATETATIAAIHISPGGQLSWFYESDQTYNSINDLEARAFRRAIERWKPHLFYTNIVWYSDNSSAIGAVNATRSKSWPLNCEIDKITSVLHSVHARLYSTWIPSAENPADYPSRYFTLPPLQQQYSIRLHRLFQRDILPSLVRGGELVEACLSSGWIYQCKSFPQRR